MGHTPTREPQRRPARWTKVDPPVAAGGDVGGDLQATESYSVRFRPVREPADGLHALVTDSWYGEATGETYRDGPFRVACHREYLICSDPSDPGSTEVWADSSFGWLGGMYATTAAAEAAAKARTPADDGADIRWDARSTSVSPARPLRPPEVELVEDDSLDMAPPDHGRDAGMERGL
jgi:hypothetical protein